MTYPAQPTDEVDNYMFGGGARTGRSLSFRTVGTSHTIVVTAKAKEQKRDDDGNPDFWPPKPGQFQGDPKMQIVLTGQTDYRDPEIENDDGIRYLYLDGSMDPASESKMGAVIGAVRATGNKSIELGSRVTLTYVGDKPKPPGSSPLKSAPKRYTASYVPAVDAMMDPGGAQNGATNGAGNGYAQGPGQVVHQVPPQQPGNTVPTATTNPAPAAPAQNGGGLAFDALEWSYLDDARLAAVQNLITGGAMTVEAARAAFPPPPGWTPPSTTGAASGGIFAGVSRADFVDTMPEPIWASIQQLVSTGIPAEQIRSMFGQFLKAA